MFRVAGTDNQILIENVHTEKAHHLLALHGVHHASGDTGYFSLGKAWLVADTAVVKNIAAINLIMRTLLFL